MAPPAGKACFNADPTPGNPPNWTLNALGHWEYMTDNLCHLLVPSDYAGAVPIGTDGLFELPPPAQVIDQLGPPPPAITPLPLTPATGSSTPSTPAVMPAYATCPAGFVYQDDGLCHDDNASVPQQEPTCSNGGLWHLDVKACGGPPPPPAPKIPLPPGASCPKGTFTGDHCVSMSPGLTGVMTKVDPTCTPGSTWDAASSSCVSEPEEPKKSSVVPYLVAGSIALVAVGLMYATLAIKPPPKTLKAT